MELLDKRNILAGAAKYDATCTSSGLDHDDGISGGSEGSFAGNSGAVRDAFHQKTQKKTEKSKEFYRENIEKIEAVRQFEVDKAAIFVKMVDSRKRRAPFFALLVQSEKEHEAQPAFAA